MRLSTRHDSRIAGPCSPVSPYGDNISMSPYGDFVLVSAFGDMRFRTPEDLGILLRERRTALGLSQAALAERVGVSRQWIVDLEQGKPRLEIGLVLRTAEALGQILEIGEDRPSDDPRVVPTDLAAVIRRAKEPL